MVKVTVDREYPLSGLWQSGEESCILRYGSTTEEVKSGALATQYA